MWLKPFLLFIDQDYFLDITQFDSNYRPVKSAGIGSVVTAVLTPAVCDTMISVQVVT